MIGARKRGLKIFDPMCGRNGCYFSDKKGQRCVLGNLFRRTSICLLQARLSVDIKYFYIEPGLLGEIAVVCYCNPMGGNGDFKCAHTAERLVLSYVRDVRTPGKLRGVMYSSSTL